MVKWQIIYGFWHTLYARSRNTASDQLFEMIVQNWKRFTATTNSQKKYYCHRQRQD